MFSLTVMEPSLSFTNVNIITIPTASFINDFGSLRAINAVLVWKEIFNTASGRLSGRLRSLLKMYVK